jgi:predicted TIM-barrel fold metal-dependent hydrolase
MALTPDQQADALTGATSPCPVIDTHMHAWTLDWARYPFAPPETSLPPPEHPNTTEEVVETAERHGVDYVVLVQVRYYGWDNRYVADSLRQYPRRFAAQGLIDPEDPAGSKHLETLVRRHGFSGVRLSPSYQPDQNWLSSRASDPLWRKAADLGAIFNFLIRPGQLPQLQAMAERFPEVPVVVDHMGYPDISQGPPRSLLALARLPNVYVRVTELYNHSLTKHYPYADVFPTVRAVYDAFSPQRLLWGTGFTRGELVGRIAYARELQLIREEIPFLTPADQEWVLGRTALSLWPFAAA